MASENAEIGMIGCYACTMRRCARFHACLRLLANVWLSTRFRYIDLEEQHRTAYSIDRL